MSPKNPLLIFIIGILTVVACVPIETNSINGASPTLTDKPKTEITPESMDGTFDLTNLNKVPPKDILEEVVYLGQGGGTDCEGSFPAPSIIADPEDTKLMRIAMMKTCGWSHNEQLDGKITYPNGKSLVSSVTVDETGEGILSFEPLLSDPVGVYQFELSGQGGQLKSNVYYGKPVEPGVYTLANNQLQLNNFLPGETVQIFIYNCKHSTQANANKCDQFGFLGWNKYVIKNDGSLLINIPDGDYYFDVISSSGLEVSPYPEKGVFALTGSASEASMNQWKEIGKKSSAEVACPANVPTHLQLQGFDNPAKISTLDGSSVGLYSNHRTDARVILQLKQGDEINVQSGPLCYDNRIWWNVVAQPDGGWISGYVIEYDGNQYYLEQVR